MKKPFTSTIKVLSLAAIMVLLFSLVVGVYMNTLGKEDYEKFFARFPSSSIKELPSVAEFTPCTVQTKVACITTKSGLNLELEGSFKRPVILKLDGKSVQCDFPRKLPLDEVLKIEAEFSAICKVLE